MNARSIGIFAFCRAKRFFKKQVITITMVRVWYEPPPYGPGTDLNRSGYGIHGANFFRKYIEKASKSPQLVAMGVPVLISLVICYIPLSTYDGQTKLTLD